MNNKKKFLFSLFIILLIIASSKIYANEEIWRTEHITQTHTKAQIIEKYKETLPKFNYNENMYEIQPSYKAPYVAGKLKKQVAIDTLNQINYYRWLYGVNEVTLNEAKMERSQKGAVIQAATNELTHTPSKPKDMDEDFYKEAYDACYIGMTDGDWHNANCAYGDISSTASIEGFISDIYNVSEGSYVGHRLNILDLDVDRTSFGYCKWYTALSMYYNEKWNMNGNNQKFYAFPSAGNFPMQDFYVDEYWSFECMEEYDMKNLKIEFTYKNKVYEQPTHYTERDCIIFKMPQELINKLGSNWKMVKAKIGVKLTGLVDKKKNIINYSYDVNFFDINEILITGISFKNKEINEYEGKKINAQNLQINPSNATEEYEIEWKSSNTNVATIDKNGKINCKKIGKTTITAKVGEFTAKYTLNVQEKPPYTLGDVNEDGKINAQDATLILKYLAKKETLSANQLLAADTDKDGKVKASDAVRILKYVAKKITEI